jgi:tetratricopeptide (TPR) repeat protein
VPPPGPTDAPAADAEPTLASALARVSPPEPPGLTFEQARIATALFGQEESGPLNVGRFRLLDRLGAGGMGVVYSAYDPELDRAVALKLVRAPDRGPETTLNEARALARLSHPNVVPIHDVGVSGLHVYLVMELVRGQTLGRWAQDRPLPDIVNAYRQAAEALAAAHAAGLVHRDFKPSNAVVGTDGRVRVVDFGLACEVADPRGGQGPGVAGTPRYMAPEQAAGAGIAPAADQYSFCRALEEAVGRQAERGSPPPRWLQAIINRGTAARPEERFPSMRELLRALSADPARIRRRRATTVGVTLALLGAVVLVPQARRRARERACAGGPERLLASWPEARQRTALARIAALGRYGGQIAPLLAQTLREHGGRWTAGYRDACLARSSGAESDALVDQRMACLERSRTALGSLPAMFQTATADALPGLVLAVNALPSPDECADLSALLSPVKPPPAGQRARVGQLRAELDRGRLQLAAGDSAQASALAQGIVDDARSLGYRPLLAEALLVQGHALMGVDRRRAVGPLEEATTLALAVGSDALAVEAWARRAWAQGTFANHAATLAGVELIEALAGRAPNARFERALLYNNIGVVEIGREQRSRAQRAFQRAFEEARGVTGPGSTELLNVQINLGFNADDPGVRHAMLSAGTAEMAARLGTEHPQTLDARYYWGLAESDLSRALGILVPACQAMAQHRHLSLPRARCWREVAFLRNDLGDTAGAIEAAELGSQAVPTGDDPDQYRALEAHVLLWRGQLAPAAKRYQQLLDAEPEVAGEAWWRKLRRAEVQSGLGRARRLLGDTARARAPLQAAVTALVPLVEKQPRVDFERRLGRARVELTSALLAAGERRAARETAARALDWLERVGGPAGETTRMRQIAGR